jgi:dihydroflavonol-4-reductase
MTPGPDILGLGHCHLGVKQMRVLVTGGTGFVGSHSVAALVSQGHQVRLLVRSRDRVARSLSPLGAADAESVLGDVTAPRSVEEAMAGCDAVLHAAAVYSLDPRAASRMRETNLRAAEIVLGAAVRMGLDPVVHVSSYVALLPPEPRGAVLTPDSPVTGPRGAYSRSKAESEQVARRYQERGAPVVIVYPGGVIGPDDPYLGDSNRAIVEFAKSGLTMRGGYPMVDVRDVAAVHAAVMEPGRGPRRYMITGHYIALPDLIAMLQEITGRRSRIVAMPAGMIRAAGGVADLVQRLMPGRLPLSHEGIWISALQPHGDDSRTARELGITSRDLRVTLADTVQWLADQGHLSVARAAGGRDEK